MKSRASVKLMETFRLKWDYRKKMGLESIHVKCVLLLFEEIFSYGDLTWRLTVYFLLNIVLRFSVLSLLRGAHNSLTVVVLAKSIFLGGSGGGGGGEIIM